MSTTETTEEKTMATKPTADTRTASELEQAVLRGDADITPTMLAEARARDDLAQLQAQAEVRRAEAEAEAARQQGIAQLAADIDALADDREHLAGLARQATELLVRVYRAANDRGLALDVFARRARDLGIAEMTVADELQDPNGIGWRAGAQLAGPARIRHNDLALTAADPLRMVTRVLRDALDQVGRRTDNVTLQATSHSVETQIDATVRTVTAPVLRKVRTIQRWGPHQPGTVVEVEEDSARWAVAKRYAVPVG
jgi:hypothetical protein